MALSQRERELIAEKVHAGVGLSAPTQEKLQFYNTYKNNLIAEIINRAKNGGQLYDPTPWKVQIWKANYIGQAQPGTPQYNNMPGNGGGGLDQTPPVIITNPGNTPTVPIGSGAGNPVNNLELNSLVAVGVGFVFIRGAFKLLTKIF